MAPSMRADGACAGLASDHALPSHSQVSPTKSSEPDPPYRTTLPRAPSYATDAADLAGGPCATFAGSHDADALGAVHNATNASSAGSLHIPRISLPPRSRSLQRTTRSAKTR